MAFQRTSAMLALRSVTLRRSFISSGLVDATGNPFVCSDTPAAIENQHLKWPAIKKEQTMEGFWKCKEALFHLQVPLGCKCSFV